MTTVTATKARSDFFKLLEMASHYGVPVSITMDGEPKAVLMSQEEYEGWQETIEIMSDSKLMKKIKQGERDSKSRKTVSWEQVKKDLKL